MTTTNRPATTLVVFCVIHSLLFKTICVAWTESKHSRIFHIRDRRQLLSEDNMGQDNQLLSEENMGQDNQLLSEKHMGQENQLLSEKHMGQDNQLLSREHMGQDNQLVSEDNMGQDNQLLSEDNMGQDNRLLSKEDMGQDKQAMSQEERPRLSRRKRSMLTVIIDKYRGYYHDVEEETLADVSTIDSSYDVLFSLHTTNTHLEAMNVTLPPRLPNYHNPCWYESIPDNFQYSSDSLYLTYYKRHPAHQPQSHWREYMSDMEHILQSRKSAKEKMLGLSWRLRCFPGFFLAGFPRCGTTDLSEALQQIGVQHGLVKETTFWQTIRFNQGRLMAGNQRQDNPFTPRMSDYLDLFDGASEVLRREVSLKNDGSAYHPGIIGDLDPHVLAHLQNWKTIRGNDPSNRNGPNFTTADHLHSLYPQAKFIILMRNPTHRAISHYVKFTRKRVTAAVMHEDMSQMIQRIENCVRDYSIRYCLYTLQLIDSSPTLYKAIILGAYAEFIRVWLHVFPRENFLFIKSEDYFRNRLVVVRKVLDFLGYDDEISASDADNILDMAPVNSTPRLDVLPETTAMLTAFYRKHNHNLKELLADSALSWDD